MLMPDLLRILNASTVACELKLRRNCVICDGIRCHEGVCYCFTGELISARTEVSTNIYSHLYTEYRFTSGEYAHFRNITILSVHLLV